jgi:dynein heavy chain
MQILGKEFTSPISYPFDKIWESSSNLEPILFLLSAGSDPTSSIE